MPTKALLVGINYTRLGQGVLNGCINDVKNMKNYIATQAGFSSDDAHMRVLVDDSDTPDHLLPTKRNMTEGFRWLLEGARPGDRLFFHYSGHGGQVRDKDGDEADGMDETLCPLDYPSAGQITDDELHTYLSVPLPEGCHLTVVTDCCHSGTMLDLPYVYRSNADGTIKMDFMAQAKEIMRDASVLASDGVGMQTKMQAGMRMFNNFKSMFSGNKKQPDQSGPTGVVKESTKKGGDIILITGCKDEQTSADAFINNAPSGALTFGLLKVLKDRNGRVTHEELLLETRRELHGKYEQIPQLCVGKEIDIKSPFII